MPEGEWRSKADEIRAAFDDRCLYRAKALLTEFVAAFPTRTVFGSRPPQEDLEQVEAMLRKVGTDLAEARELARAGSVDLAIREYIQILEIAADSNEATAALLKYPPDPPGKPRAENTGVSVRVRWTVAQGVGIGEYLVAREEVRNSGEASEQVRVYRGPKLECEDAGAAAGIPYRYRVSSIRGGVFSKPAESDVVVPVAEVSGLSLEAGDGTVEGSWTLPSHALSAIVTRSEETSPGVIAPGVSVALQSRLRFLDTDARNGGRYEYRIRTVFSHPTLGQVTSAGAVRTVCPEAPLRPVRDLSIAVDGGTTAAHWEPMARGEVSVYLFSKQPTFHPGQRLSVQTVRAWPNRFDPGASQSAQLITPGPGTYYALPVTIDREEAVAGAFVRFAVLEDIKGLDIVDCQAYLQLLWEWPDGATHALVSMKKNGFPAGPEDPAATKDMVSKAEYRQQNGSRWASDDKCPHYFTVYATTRRGDEVYDHAPGTGDGARLCVRGKKRVACTYKIEKLRLWKLRGRWITLTVEVEASEVRDLPGLVLVGRSGEGEFQDLHEGSEIDAFEPSSSGQGCLIVRKIPLRSVKLPVCLRLLPAQAAAKDTYDIRHPRIQDRILR